MSERNRALTFGALTAATLSCLTLLLVCPHRADCVKALTQLDAWLGYGGRVVLPVVSISVAVWAGRLACIVLASQRWSRRLPPQPPTPALLEAIQRTGVPAVIQVAGGVPDAFCAGAIRPRIYVTEAALRCLGRDELDVVLLHEHDHVRRCEPMVRAAYQAATDVFFYIPILHWLAQRRVEESELRADRAALERLGRRPVAAALWTLGRGGALQGTAAFGGVTELRVAQVLGDPVPRRSLTFSTVAASAMGLYLALQVASCLLPAFQRL